MQTNNRIFDDLAKVITGAAGAAQGMRSEVDSLVRAQIERIIGDLDLVPREEFEAAKAMAVKAREENMRLEARLVAFEARLSALVEGEDGPRDVPETNGFVREAH
ncbi:MAG: accessory factor UbiK family protein [Alphaproteobacteria bacterium]